MNQLGNKWKIIAVLILIVAMLYVVASCSKSGKPQIKGVAEIIAFDYDALSRDVRFTAIVVGITEYGEEVVRRWQITSLQFQQLEIGDRVRRVNGRVIKIQATLKS
ncbi:MAG: hypothetical protein FWB80_08120 [Defluviitaleaceae bacterium]|nr:hypothetical protein [Defluviitaleaceae bacterium]